MLYTCMYDIRSNRTCVGKPLVTYIIPCLSSIYIRVTVLNPYLSCFLYICIYSVCLRWFIFEVIKKNSSASVLNSYNFTILIYKGTVFYLRNVCVSHRLIHFIYSYVAYVAYIFLLVFAARISVLVFPTRNTRTCLCYGK